MLNLTENKQSTVKALRRIGGVSDIDRNSATLDGAVSGQLKEGRRPDETLRPGSADLAGFEARFRSYSSTLASSINITGMSSLIG